MLKKQTVKTGQPSLTAIEQALRYRLIDYTGCFDIVAGRHNLNQELHFYVFDESKTVIEQYKLRYAEDDYLILFSTEGSVIHIESIRNGKDRNQAQKKMTELAAEKITAAIQTNKEIAGRFKEELALLKTLGAEQSGSNLFHIKNVGLPDIEIEFNTSDITITANQVTGHHAQELERRLFPEIYPLIELTTESLREEDVCQWVSHLRRVALSKSKMLDAVRQSSARFIEDIVLRSNH